MHALISTLTATEAPNGIDMFSGTATKLIYICPVSSSCSPHVTSCHVGALIAVSPWLCCLLLLFLAFLPLAYSVVSYPASLSFTVSLHDSPPLYFLYFLPDHRRECRSLLGKEKPTSFFHSQILFLHAVVNSSPHDDALRLPPRCILSQDRIDDLFYWKEMRAWESRRFSIPLNELFS